MNGETTPRPASTGPRPLRLTGREPALRAFLDACPSDDDEALAQMIDADGRARIARGEPLRLADYLAAKPSLREMPIALDAAIDMALRSRSGRTRPTAEHVEALVREHPEMERAIRDASLMSRALWSTDQSPPYRSRYTQSVPCDFGAPLPGGQPPYRLIRPLGSGSTGEVFLAEDTQLSEEGVPAYVAIKLLSARAEEDWTRRRLIEEAAKARRVDHPNVVRALHCGVTQHAEDYVVFEFINGPDLLAWAGDHGLPLAPRGAAVLIRHIARAVHAAHSVGLAHCDLKPANVLISAAGEPKVTDFGIAVRWQGAATPARRQRAAPAGTLAFMAPEQFRREDGAAAPPADIYALGGMLYWLLTGRLPNGETPEEISFTHDAAIGRKAGPSPRRHAPAVDADLDAVCARALGPKPSDRHASAAEFADDLQSWLERRAIRWRKPSMARQTRLWAMRRPWVAALLACLVIGAGGSLAVFWRLSTVAAQRRTDAAIARAAQAAAEEGRKLAAATVPIMIQRFQNYWDLAWAEQGLAWTRVFEEIYGPRGMNQPEAAGDLREKRLGVLRAMANAAHDADGKPAIARVVWQTEIAFHGVAAGDYEEPERLATSIREDWASILSATDPLWRAIDVIEAGAAANRALQRPGLDNIDLADIALLLRRHADDLKGSRDWGPIRALALTKLTELLKPEGLNRPDELALALAELEHTVLRERPGAVDAQE